MLLEQVGYRRKMGITTPYKKVVILKVVVEYFNGVGTLLVVPEGLIEF
jgi:hypothetical protein